MAFEQRLMDKNNEWIRVGDLVTSDGYWAYEVFEIWGGKIVFGLGAPQSPRRFRHVDPADVDEKGRVISRAAR